jgi:histidine triad (HIT) family protein
VTTPKDNSPACVFCDIIAGQASAVIVREWVDTIAFLPREENGRRGCTDGHVLVVPRVHVPDFIADPVVSAVTALRLAELARDLRERTGHHFNEITSAGETPPNRSSIFTGTLFPAGEETAYYFHGEASDERAGLPNLREAPRATSRQFAPHVWRYDLRI